MAKVAVVGGGLCGCLLAVYLGQRGFAVEVFERRPDYRGKEMPGGRSINLALSARGLAALRAVGLEQEVIADGIPMHGRMLHARDGSLTYVPYGHPGQFIYSISRQRLNEQLMTAAERMPNVKIHFDVRVRRVDLKDILIQFERAGTAGLEQARIGAIFGTDGAYSAVREAMQHTDGFNYSQEYLDHGYKELCIPATSAGGFAMQNEHALHIWPRGDYMMIALPNKDRSWTCTLFMPLRGAVNSFERIRTTGQARAFFEREFPDALSLMPTFDADWARNACSSLMMVHAYPWHVGTSSLLLGDSAHATVPFFGQGMNASLQDVQVFAQHLDACSLDLQRAIPAFAAAHYRNGDALIQLSKENYIEMRYKVATRLFRLRRTVELYLNRLFPSLIVPRYSLVSFDTVPYAEVIERVARQDRALSVLAGVCVAGSLLVLGFAAHRLRARL